VHFAPGITIELGHSLPFDSNFVTYVWFDALVNYISIAAAHGDAIVLSALNPQPLGAAKRSGDGSTLNPQLSLWPADIHVIGKDIVKISCCLLADYAQGYGVAAAETGSCPRCGERKARKSAKALGNIVDPVAVIDEWGVDAFRFYVLRELDIGPDGNWTDADSKLVKRRTCQRSRQSCESLASMLKRYRKELCLPSSNELPTRLQKVITETPHGSNRNNFRPPCTASGRSSQEPSIR